MPVRVPPAGTQPLRRPGAAAETTPTPAAPAAPGEPTPAEVSDAGGAAWRDFNAGSAAPKARITGFSSPLVNASGLLDFEWEKPGDKIPFELTIDVEGAADQVTAEVWTNANHNDEPGRFEAVPMKLVSASGGKATFRADVPIDRIGNYRAVGRVSVDGGQSWQWMGEQGLGDVRFRPRAEQHDALNLMEVSVGNLNLDEATKTPGTFADMMDSGSPETNGKYTLEWLAKQGKTAIWLMPPFEVSKWENRHPVDDAGSPYAVKDYFSIRTELSRDARGLEGEAARDAAMAEFKRFIDKAHSLGIKVILDVALNHVGHNYEFRDLFVRYDEAGREVREVKKNDFSNVALSERQLEVIKRRVADPDVPDYMEYLAPWMYGATDGDPKGADSVFEKAPGGWFEWHDTAQLNHGRMRHGYHWYDVERRPEHEAVQGWLTRILRFWSVDMDVDGFRLDHLTGLPLAVLEEATNKAQADVDRHQPGKHLFLMGEDFHTNHDTRHWLDAGQGGWFHELLRARSPQDLQRVVEDPWFHDLKNLSSHDEERMLHHFGGDWRGATRLASLLQLFGGPVAEVAGDHYGAKWKLPFKQYRNIAELRSIDGTGKEMAAAFGRVGRARKEIAALHDDNRAFLQPRVGGPDPDLLAMSRWHDEKDGGFALVLANLNNHRARENAFSLDEDTRSRIDPDQRYQAFDALSDGSRRPLWDPPLTGRELLDKGVFTRLEPYQIQVLTLAEA